MSRMILAFFMSFTVHTAVVFMKPPSEVDLPKVEISTGKTSISIVFKEKVKKIELPKEIIEVEKAIEPIEEIKEIVPEKVIEEPIVEEKIEEIIEPIKVEEPVQEEALPELFSVESEGVQWIEPQYRKNDPPQYPRKALLNNIEGLVQLIVFIDEKGYPTLVEIEKSSKSYLLDQAALRTVKKWQFVPAERAGHGIKSKASIPIHFKIERRSKK